MASGTLSALGVLGGTAADAIRGHLLKYWREVVKSWGPNRREVWLKSSEAIAALGAKRVKELLKGIRNTRRRLEESMAGPAWVDAWGRSGELPPSFDAYHQGGGFQWRGRWRAGAVYSRGDVVRYEAPRDGIPGLRGGTYFCAIEANRMMSPGVCGEVWRELPAETRQYAARMILSRCHVRVGQDGEPSRRFTPPQAVAVEDELDGLSENEAFWYEFPASPSAAVIRRIGEMRAREV